MYDGREIGRSVRYDYVPPRGAISQRARGGPNKGREQPSRRRRRSAQGREMVRGYAAAALFVWMLGGRVSTLACSPACGPCTLVRGTSFPRVTGGLLDALRGVPCVSALLRCSLGVRAMFGFDVTRGRSPLGAWDPRGLGEGVWACLFVCVM